ncbi:unnamed protein product [Prorocentrum cordatum]|uniref:MMS19 nucleotide excision repair protein n=1 Tax=Prorocentrum cordatum TaxID=2364126 RepID=A0ABN9UTN5_9DINO|nr:unnamed protein product [Polarella glacialis]
MLRGSCVRSGLSLCRRDLPKWSKHRLGASEARRRSFGFVEPSKTRFSPRGPVRGHPPALPRTTDDDTDEERQAALKCVVEALSAQQIALLDVVVALESALSAQAAPSERRNAVVLLRDCLLQAQLRLNFKHVSVLVTFFCSKITDWQCVEGALGGLLALMQHHGPVLRTLKSDDDEPMVTRIAAAVFKDVHTPSHGQAGRKLCLDFAYLLLREWRGEAVALGPKLGEAISGMIEEERDPRNLLLSFAIVPALFECEASCASEQTITAIFETLSSYFPITFTPAKDDKVGITGDDLREGLRRALGCSARLAGLAAPFLLDAARDAHGGEAADAPAQACSTLGACLEMWGPSVAQKYVGEVLKTAENQVCRTFSPDAGEFSSLARRALAAAMKGTPAGLYPAWLGKEVEPHLKARAADAAKGSSSLASAGSRQLLLAAAAAHPALLDRVWSSVVPLLVPPATEVTDGALLPLGSLAFALDLAGLAQGPNGKVLLAPRHVKQLLAAALATLLALPPGSDGANCTSAAAAEDAYGHGHAHGAAAAEDAHAHGHAHGGCCGGGCHGSDDSGAAPTGSVATALRLTGLLARLAGGEEESRRAFHALRLALLPPLAEESPTFKAWAEGWRHELLAAPEGDARASALVDAVADVAGGHPAHAAVLAPALTHLQASTVPPWLATELPRLMSTAAVCLARQATADGAGTDGAAAVTAGELLERAIQLARPGGRPAAAAAKALVAIAAALENPAAPAAATAWAAGHLVTAAGLPSELPRLCAGPSGTGDGDLQELAPAARELLRALLLRLPKEQGRVIRRGVFEAVAASENEDSALPSVALVPAVLPAAAEEDWAACDRAFPRVCSCMLALERPSLEPIALDAVGSLVEHCPAAQAEPLVASLRDSLGKQLGAGAGAVNPAAARGAARCCTAAVAALLRRGGFAAEAAGLLDVLTGALDTGSASLEHVPLGIQVLAPPNFGDSAPPLPPVALQQLSRTVLPMLMTRAKGGTAKGAVATEASRAALQSAVALLSTLRAEVACTDCAEELRWCALTGLKHLAGASSAQGHPSVFAAQVVQLAVRAISRNEAWVEDDLQSVVPPLAALCATHRVPLVRLGCLQALRHLSLRSSGHLAPFRKQIELAIRKATEDRRREVRLMAVAALNALLCGNAS